MLCSSCNINDDDEAHGEYKYESRYAGEEKVQEMKICLLEVPGSLCSLYSVQKHNFTILNVLLLCVSGLVLLTTTQLASRLVLYNVQV